MSTQPLVDCFAAHRSLAENAHDLARALQRRSSEEPALLRLGANCVRLSSEFALVAQKEQEAIRRWHECAHGERQIRSATYWALARKLIGTPEYDWMFETAIHAARARALEVTRLRHRLQRSLLG
jgi:hypothetical protein